MKKSMDKYMKKDILEKINNGEIDMKPKWHFVLKSAWVFFGVVVVTLVSIYLLSFVMFFLAHSGIGFLPLYGFRGVSMFVMSSPWLLIVSVAIFMFLLYELVCRYSFSYRRPLIYSMLGVTGFVLIGSFFLSQTQVHPRLRNFADNHRVPIFTPMYQGVEQRLHKDVTPGVVLEVLEEGFMMEVLNKDVVFVKLISETKYDRVQGIDVGQIVFVFGPKNYGEIEALGVKLAPKHFRMEGGVQEERGKGWQAGDRVMKNVGEK